MRLSLYFARQFATVFAVVFAGFGVILFLLDLVDEVNRFQGLGFGTLTGMAALHSPDTLYTTLPLVMILSTIGTFLRLARTSELIAARAAGQSALKILLAPVLTAFVIGLLAVAVMNPIVAGTKKRYETLAGAYGRGGTTSASFEGDGLWLRQGDDQGQWVIHAARANADGRALFDVTFIAFGLTGGPKLRIEAASAELKDGEWVAKAAKEWNFDTQGNPEAEAKRRDTLTLRSELTADQVRNSFGTPSSVSFWDIRSFIARLERAGFSARPYAVAYQMSLAQPLMLAAMVLVGAGFTMRHTRFGQTGLFVLLALASGLAIFFVRNFAQVLGESGQIPILLAAWTPPIAAILLSVSLLLHLEDG